MLTDGFIVYNLAHTNQTIRSKCGSLRFLGAFSTREEAEAFVQEWTLEQPDLETRVSPFNQWRVLSKTFWDLETQKRVFADRWSVQVKDREEEFKDVEHRAANKIAGPVRQLPVQNLEKSLEQAPVPETQQVPNVSTESFVPRVPKKLEVISQKLIGIAIVQDDTSKTFEEQEPFFQVLCVGDNESEMEDFLKKHSQEQVDALGVQSSVPLAAVTMQDFVPLSKISTVRTRRQSPNQHLEEIRKNFSFENKDGGLDDSGVAGLAQADSGKDAPGAD